MVGENGIFLLIMIKTKFKNTEIGLIPEDWEIVLLEEVGSNYSYGVGAEAVPFDGKNKYLRITDIDDQSHRFAPSPLVSPSYYSEDFVLKENEIVVARTGASVGKSYCYNSEDGRLIYAGFLMKFRVPRDDYRYIFYQLTTSRYQKWVAINSVRSGQPGLNLMQLKEFLLSLPPTKEEQSRIATALYDIDTLIRNLDRTIEKKKNIRQGAMEQLLSGKKRLPGFKGEWEQVEIGNVCKRMKRGEVLSAAEMNTGVFPVIAAGTEPAGHCDKYNRNPMTISVSGSGANAGFVAFHKNRIFATDCFTIGASDEYDVEFIYYVLKMRQKEIFKLQTGGAQPHVYPRDLSSLSVYYTADIQEQRAIADTLTAMDDEIAVLQMERDKYANIRSGMMDNLLTGAKRI